jgi:hypothetical protein
MNADENPKSKPQPSQPDFIDLEAIISPPAESGTNEASTGEETDEMANWDTLLSEISAVPEPEPEPVPEPEPESTPASAELADTRQQIAAAQASFGQMMQGSIADLERRRQKLEISIDQLERRRDRLKQEIGQSFAGASQDMAIRVQGFKDYLVGSLQDLVIIAEETEFPAPPPPQTIRIETPPPPARANPPADSPAPTGATSPPPQFAESPFQATGKRVKRLLAEYRSAPDYYGPPWQLRRSLEPKQADKIDRWFFELGGRGSLMGSNSRLQNVTVAAGAIAILREFYGEDLRTLILANLPERLGDWRRGLQDCLGVSKSDFGGGGGIILFENPNALVQKADRIVNDGEMPLIIIDDSEGLVSLSLLQYPLWLAFIPTTPPPQDDYRY